MTPFDNLILKIDSFIRKFYKNLLIKGVFYSLSLLLVFFLGILTIENIGGFGTFGRALLFYGYLFIAILIFVYYIIIPISKLLKFGKIISYKQAAIIIGNHFSEANDKILNILQLHEQGEKTHNKNYNLLLSSINQKTNEVSSLSFSNVINYKENLKYFFRFLLLLLPLILIYFINPSFITSNTDRIINHNTVIVQAAAFTYTLNSKELKVLENEDYNLEVLLKGREIPDNIYISYNNLNIALNKNSPVSYSYLFRNVQKSINFTLNDGINKSQNFILSTIPKPSLQEFSISFDYPKYTNIQNDSLNNLGDLIIPKGTKVKWVFTTKNVDSLSLEFTDTIYKKNNANRNTFNINKLALNNDNYKIKIQNRYSDYIDSSSYSIDIIDDMYPTIKVSDDVDSLNNDIHYFKGSISDDYGFSKLMFVYKKLKAEKYSKKIIKINTALTNNIFYHYYDFSTLDIDNGESIDYYFEIWDNDAISGSKSTKSKINRYTAPTKKEIEEEIKKNNLQIKEDINESIKEASEIKKELQNIRNELLNKKNPDWQDKNRIENLINKQQNFQEQINKINKNQKLSKKQELNEELLKKQEQLNKLFDELMSDEMKKLYKELQELMEEMNKDKILENLENIELNQEDMLKELDRSIEQFKQAEFEQNLESLIEKTEKLSEKQAELSKESLEKDKSDFEINKKQENLKEEFADIQKDIDELKKLNEELENSKKMPDLSKEKEETSKEMNESLEKIEQGKNKKASEAQKKASESLKKLASKMKSMQSNSESLDLDMDSLKQLLENLVHFSFKQEKIIGEFKNLSTNDPKYVKLGQEQQRLQEELKVIEDSLFALSKRVSALGPHINKELISMKKLLNKSIKNITERQTSKANINQQTIMTSANNLALLLDEVLKQMQSSKPGSGKCSKPGGSNPNAGEGMKKSLKQMKEQIESMKKALEKGKEPGGKKQGDKAGQSSESLARMAAKQAQLQKQLSEISQELNKDGSSLGNGIKKIVKELEKVQEEIINDDINENTLFRQQQILSKLLEHEKAIREQEMDNKRESKEIKDYENSNPNQFIEYKKKKNKEVELLKTIPIDLKPYYKNKVNQYFNNIQ